MADGLRLVMGQGPQPGQTFMLDRDVLTLGRDPSNSIAINEPQVSRQHARITRQGAMMVIEDLGSTNGTYINGMRLTGPYALNNGDAIGLGEVVTLTVSAETAATTEAMAGQPAPAQPPSYAPAQPPSYAPAQPPSYAPAQPPSYAPPAPAAPPQPAPAYVAAPPEAAPPLGYEYEEEGKEKWSRVWLYVGCGCLVLILICVAVAVFLWFAPTSFWQALMDLGIPVPSNPF